MSPNQGPESRPSAPPPGPSRSILDRPISRRRVVVGGLAAGALALTGAGALGAFGEPTGAAAATPQAGGPKGDPTPLAAPATTKADILLRRAEALSTTEVFANILSSESELRANPADITNFFPEVDGNGNLIGINLICNDANGSCYRFSRLNSDGKLSPWYQRTQSLGISGKSVNVSGSTVNIAGAMDESSSEPVILRSKDGGKNYTRPSTSGLSGPIADQVATPDNKSVLLNVRTLNAATFLAIQNLATGEVTKVPGTNAYPLENSLILASSGDANRPILYAAIQTGGYLEASVDLTTKQVTSSVTKHPEFGQFAGFTITKDSQGKATKILATHNPSQTLHIIDAATNVDTPVYFGNLLDGKGIPNYDTSSLRLSALQVVGDNVWAGGTYQTPSGESRAILVSWKLGTNPAQTLKHFVLEDNKISSVVPNQMKSIKINGKCGILTNVGYLGFVFTETAADGSAIDNPLKLYIKNPTNAQEAPALAFRTFAGVVGKGSELN